MVAGKETMNAIVVEEYGGIDNLVHKIVEKPSAPEGYDVLVKYVKNLQSHAPVIANQHHLTILPQRESMQR